MAHVDDAFAGFVERERPSLLRTGLLLTGDARDAEALVTDALARVRRRWRRTTGADGAAAAARTELVRAYLRTRPGPAADQLIDAPEDADLAWLHGADQDQAHPDQAHPDQAGPDDDLAREWRRLEPRVRVALTLGPVEHRPPGEVARLVGRPEREVGTGIRAGLVRLHAAGGSDADLAAQLLPAVPGPAPWQHTDRTAAREATRRHLVRRRIAAVAAGAAVAACALVAAVLAWPGGTPSEAARGAADRGPAGVPSAPVLVEPTRGSLADDAAFLTRVRSVDWATDAAPPVDEREVVLATDTPSGRVVLVAGRVGRQVRGAWLTGPAGAPADELVPYLSERMSRTEPAGVLVSDGSSATLVVVAAPGDSIDVSPRLEIASDGTATRAYTASSADEGVAVVPVDDVAAGLAAGFRVRRDGAIVHRDAFARPDDVRVPAPALALEPARPVELRPEPGVVGEAVARASVPLGVDPATLEPELLWSAALTRTGGLGTVAVVTGRVPRGGRLVTTLGYLGTAGTGRPIPCGTRTLADDGPVAELTAAAVCSVSDGNDYEADRTWLVVTAPERAVRAEVLDDRGTVLDTVDLVSGGSVSRTPDGAAAVRTLDAAGRPLGAAPVDGPGVAFGDYGDGDQE